MATAPLLLLIAAAIPRPCDVAVAVWHAAESAIVAHDARSVEAPKPHAKSAAPSLDVKAPAAVPAVLAAVKREPAPPILVDVAPLRVGEQAPAMALRRAPAQPQAPPAR